MYGWHWEDFLSIEVESEAGASGSDPVDVPVPIHAAGEGEIEWCGEFVSRESPVWRLRIVDPDREAVDPRDGFRDGDDRVLGRVRWIEREAEVADRMEVVGIGGRRGNRGRSPLRRIENEEAIIGVAEEEAVTGLEDFDTPIIEEIRGKGMIIDIVVFVVFEGEVVEEGSGPAVEEDAGNRGLVAVKGVVVNEERG